MKESITRKIIHIDMDAFFASIEQVDHPHYRGKPLVVGGSPYSRGVVATCSYEARKYGIHSAMSSRLALQRCPHAIFVRPRMDRYREVSQIIFSIYRTYTDLIEPIALDEAYLDVTEDKLGIGSATIIAQKIKKEIFIKTKLTASAGVSYNKFLAKVASDYEKPNGLTVVTPADAYQFIDAIPIGNFFGVGKVTEEILLRQGIRNGAKLREVSLVDLEKLLGKRGEILYHHVRGIDNRPIVPNRKRKSLGKEKTLTVNIDRVEEMVPILEECASLVSKRLKEQQLFARIVVLKVRFHDFKIITRRTTLDEPTSDLDVMMEQIKSLLNELDFTGRSVRLLGVTTMDFVSEKDMNESHSKRESVQLELFDWR